MSDHEASQSKQREPRHRIEMIETEINVLRQVYQSPATTGSQRSIIIERTTKLLAEEEALLGKHWEGRA